MITLKKIIETCGDIEIYKEGRWMPVTEEIQQKFDHDLEFGRLGEDFVKAFQSENTKVEVKTERDIWKTTGNIVFEIRCKGKPSGISKTKADYWAQILTYKNEIKSILIFPVGVLKLQLKNLLSQNNLKFK